MSPLHPDEQQRAEREFFHAMRIMAGYGAIAYGVSIVVLLTTINVVGLVISHGVRQAGLAFGFGIVWALVAAVSAYQNWSDILHCKDDRAVFLTWVVAIAGGVLSALCFLRGVLWL